jgi:hypothetical protein
MSLVEETSLPQRTRHSLYNVSMAVLNVM